MAENGSISSIDCKELELSETYTQSFLRCKKRIHFNGLTTSLDTENPFKSVGKRNERERKRVKVVNQGFATLRQHLPIRKNKKTSKVETLRAAVEYINQLNKLLNGIEDKEDNQEDDQVSW